MTQKQDSRSKAPHEADECESESQTGRARWLSAAKDPATTPMMAQFCSIKADYDNALLFYRMGDFYELFFEDAEKAAATLDITLTKRGKHAGDDIPMAGVPVHAAEMYLSRLIKAGHRVAVCEQTEDPAEAKKRGSKAVVRREVIRLVTPGTLSEDTLLDARANNYLVALAQVGGRGTTSELALAAADMSTGAFLVLPVTARRLDAHLARLDAVEILVSETAATDDSLAPALFDWRDRLTILDPKLYDSKRGADLLKALFGVEALDGLGDFDRADCAAVAALLTYLEETQKGQLPRLERPVKESSRATMMIDAATRRSLELTRTQNGENKGSLLATIDRTVTGPGSRMLASRLTAPLTDPEAINARLDSVSHAVERASLTASLRAQLKSSPDMARALGRLALDRGGPRDLAAIAQGLRCAMGAAAELEGNLGNIKGLPRDLAEAVSALKDHYGVADLLSQALDADPPLLARDGGFVAPGYEPALDELRTLRDEGRRHIAALEVKYRDETGIQSLKVKHNNVLGYHIDVSAKHGDTLMAPPHEATFIHRQTLANAVRFSTTELAELAGKISRAGDQETALELEIFRDLSAKTLVESTRISEAAVALAEIDVMAALAELALSENHVRPIIDDSHAFAVTAGRHPVVEASLRAAANRASGFVANDCDLSADRRLWLITGPNMAGKSTFLRQNALIAVLAQMGAYVPASHAHIGVVDRLFSRVGASDDLAHGRSTFMVEMVETAAILNQAGPRSLVILDEIGRGTSTYDGLSIAWAAIEHLHDINQSRALFATHYHELTVLKETLDSLALRSMKVREWKGDVVFLHEVAQGAADRSYGIQVAKLAGLPAVVVGRAKAVLDHLERSDDGRRKATLIDDLPLFSSQDDLQTEGQDSATRSALEEKLDTVNPDMLSARDALNLVYDLKDLLKAADD